MDFEKEKQKAIKFIGISKKTEYEVKQKLLILGYNQEIVDMVISYLLNIGYIDDIDYVKSYIKQNERFMKYSIFEITQKLLQKGIKKDIIENEITILEDLEYDNKVYEKLMLTKCKDMEPLRLKQYLYRRGLKVDEE